MQVLHMGIAPYIFDLEQFVQFSSFLVCLNGISSVCNVKFDTDKETFHVFQMRDLLFHLLFFIDHYYYLFIYFLLYYLFDFLNCIYSILLGANPKVPLILSGSHLMPPAQVCTIPGVSVCSFP